jgi:hypothetical protein
MLADDWHSKEQFLGYLGLFRVMNNISELYLSKI